MFLPSGYVLTKGLDKQPYISKLAHNGLWKRSQINAVFKSKMQTACASFLGHSYCQGNLIGLLLHEITRFD